MLYENSTKASRPRTMLAILCLALLAAGAGSPPAARAAEGATEPAVQSAVETARLAVLAHVHHHGIGTYRRAFAA
jgi:hypothetical protein